MLQNSTSDVPNRFRGLRVAITGGTSGLGFALVRELPGSRSAGRCVQQWNACSTIHGWCGWYLTDPQRRFWRASLITAGRSNTRTSGRQWRFGTSGRRLPVHRLHSNRHRPVLHSIGARCHLSRSVVFDSQPSLTPRESRPQAIQNWMRCCHSTNHISFRHPLPYHSVTRGSETGESSLSAQAWCGRSKPQPDSTARCGQATEWLLSASGAPAACA